MNKKFTRILSAFLCLAMVFCLIPWGTVSAAPVRKTAKQPKGMPAQPKAIQSWGDERYFTTFEDLKVLAGESYSDVVYAYYQGSDMLTISEDIYLPDNLVLVVDGIMVVNSHVEFSAEYMFVDSLAVSGTVEAVYAEIYTYFNITDNAAYYNCGELHLWGDSFLSGEQRITHMDGTWTAIWYDPETMDELKAVSAEANAATNGGIFYCIRISSYITITEDMTFPANCEVYIDGVDVTVAEGVALAQHGYVWMYGGLIVDGTLINDGTLDLYYEDGGILLVNGSCSGTGTIYVTGWFSDPFTATPGLTGYSAEYDGNYDCWALIYTGEVPPEEIPPTEEPPTEPPTEPPVDSNQLGTPTDLGWGYDYEEGVAMPGVMSWKNGLPDTGEFEVNVFRDGSHYDTYWWYYYPEGVSYWHSVRSFILSDPATGEYYFTVTAIDEYGDYESSPAAVSENWFYVQPDAALGAPTNLRMDETQLRWDLPADDTYVAGYQVLLYHSADDPEDMYLLDYADIYDKDAFESIECELSDPGYYSFEIRLISSDISQVCNGPWVTLSEPFCYGVDPGTGDTPPGEDDNDDDNIVDDSQLPFSAYEWEVLKIANQERLAQGLNPLTMYDLIQQATDIRAVEVDQYFSHTRPDGTSCFTVFDEVGIRWGAVGENIATGQRSPAEVMNDWMNSEGHRANILTSGFAHMGVGYYQGNSMYGTSWVQLFTDGGKYTSINVLTGDGYAVEPGTTIDEMGLVAVLDSTTYGTCYLPVAEAYCSGYDPDKMGTQTVTVSVLGVKTTFQVTVGSGEMKGDFVGDSVVDDADVAYLLWFTLFPDTYPLSGNGDLNGDGKVDDADVAYLLWHTLFPEAYPL